MSSGITVQLTHNGMISNFYVAPGSTGRLVDGDASIQIMWDSQSYGYPSSSPNDVQNLISAINTLTYQLGQVVQTYSEDRERLRDEISHWRTKAEMLESTYRLSKQVASE